MRKQQQWQTVGCITMAKINQKTRCEYECCRKTMEFKELYRVEFNQITNKLFVIFKWFMLYSHQSNVFFVIMSYKHIDRLTFVNNQLVFQAKKRTWIPKETGFDWVCHRWWLTQKSLTQCPSNSEYRQKYLEKNQEWFFPLFRTLFT